MRQSMEPFANGGQLLIQQRTTSFQQICVWLLLFDNNMYSFFNS
jgi:hypothetical protein